MDKVLTVPQSNFFTSTAKYTAAVAGFGSGKTDVAMTTILDRKFRYPAIDQAYLAPTYPLIRDIFYPKVSAELSEIGIPHHINVRDNMVHIQGHGRIICRTMNDPNMIIGWEAGDAFLDEFDILPTDKAKTALRKVSARLRTKYPDKKKNQVFITTTPEGFKATYELFDKKPLPNSSLVQMSTYSNAHNLPEDYIDDLLAQYPDELIRAYLLGQFVNLTSGAVYPYFDRERNNTHYLPRPRETLHIGMDFNVYRMFASVHIIRNNIPYAVGELVDIQDTPAMIEAIKDTYPDHPTIIYPDSTGDNASSKGASLTDIKLLKVAKLRVSAPSKNPYVRDRINSVNCKFQDSQGNISYYVNVEHCPNLTMCFEQQVYDKNGEPDKSSNLDHGPDSAGYFIHRRWPVGRPAPLVTPIGDFSSEVDHSI